MIEEVSEDSPASRAGLKKGDIVVEFDGERVRSAIEELGRVGAKILRTDERDANCPVTGRIGGDYGPGGCDSWVITIDPAHDVALAIAVFAVAIGYPLTHNAVVGRAVGAGVRRLLRARREHHGPGEWRGGGADEWARLRARRARARERQLADLSAVVEGATR